MLGRMPDPNAKLNSEQARDLAERIEWWKEPQNTKQFPDNVVYWKISELTELLKTAQR